VLVHRVDFLQEREVKNDEKVEKQEGGNAPLTSGKPPDTTREEKKLNTIMGRK